MKTLEKQNWKAESPPIIEPWSRGQWGVGAGKFLLTFSASPDDLVIATRDNASYGR